MGGTPLHHAAWWGHGDVVEELLARGADPQRRAEPGIGGTRARRGPRTAPSTPPARWRAAAPTTCGSLSGWWPQGATVEPEMVHAAAGELAEWLAAALEAGGEDGPGAPAG